MWARSLLISLFFYWKLNSYTLVSNSERLFYFPNAEFSVPCLFTTSPDKQPSASFEDSVKHHHSEFLPLRSLKMLGDRNRGPRYHLLRFIQRSLGRKPKLQTAPLLQTPILYTSDLNLSNVVSLWYSSFSRKNVLLLSPNCNFAAVMDHRVKLYFPLTLGEPRPTGWEPLVSRVGHGEVERAVAWRVRTGKTG